MLNQSCIAGKTSLSHNILLLYTYWLWFTDNLLKIFVSILMRDIGLPVFLLHICLILVSVSWLLSRWPCKMSWKVFLFFFLSLCRLGIISPFRNCYILLSISMSLRSVVTYYNKVICVFFFLTSLSRIYQFCLPFPAVGKFFSFFGHLSDVLLLPKS